MFVASGNWGSTIYDGPESGCLEIWICDRCVTSRRVAITIHGDKELYDKIRDDVAEFLDARAVEIIEQARGGK
jgi:hypothetical protein